MPGVTLMEGTRPYALPSPSSRFGVILGRKMLTRLSENRQSGALTQAYIALTVCVPVYLRRVYTRV